jgi:MFS superfamily sulfate permease-like transporter
VIEGTITNRRDHGYFPIWDWILQYRKEWARSDVIAGLTTAAVVIPKAMAYATIAGLPVEVGLYTAFLPMLLYAVLGTSRPLSVSTSTTIAILAATQLGQVATGGDPASLLSASAALTLLFVLTAGLHRQFHLRTGTHRF